MVRMDWDRILSTKAETLTDDEIEDLFPMVIRCDIDDVENINNLRALMKLSQEMLQHKDNQVEALLLECDELKEKVSSATSPSAKTLRQTSPIIAADDSERDNGDLETDYSATESFQDTMKMKNDKIKTLMHELESLEKENEVLKSKLELLKDEMEDATENMDEMTEELEQLRGKDIFHKDTIDGLEREKSELMRRIRDLGSELADRDNAIDDFGEAIDMRISEWKTILDERDAEISRLRDDLSHALTQSVRTVRDQSKSQVVRLNEEINHRDAIIDELRKNLVTATAEINESATIIEKLKTDANKLAKTGRRKEHRDLLKKLQEANEKISDLRESLIQAEDQATLKSEQLCETLGNLKRYEDKDRGLAETMKEMKSLKEQLSSKSKHVQDLISVVNNLEALNSTREMQILALREKFDIPDDEEIFIDRVVQKREEENRMRNELIRKNEALMQHNLDMQSDIRVLRYKLSKLECKTSVTCDKIDGNEAAESPRKGSSFPYDVITAEQLTSLSHVTELDETKENVRVLTEENEALRKGMHEILDSIHDQDGKSTVEVRSEILENLLESLDVRHVAGWYHPAMRLQERVNVVQGSNAELRLQVKHMRKELENKDDLLRIYCSKSESMDKKKSNSDESDDEETNMYVIEMKRIQDCYRDELENWQKERDSLNAENEELRDSIEKLTAQFSTIENDLRTMELGDDELKSAFAAKTRESAESVVQLIIANRKLTTVENLLNAETEKFYRTNKEAIDVENGLRKNLEDVEKRNRTLESEILSIRSNLTNSVSLIAYNELKEKYDESCIQLRASYEWNLGTKTMEQISESHNEKISSELENSHRIDEINSELRRQLVDLHKEISRQMKPEKLVDEKNCKTNEEYEKLIETLEIENKSLSRNLEISRQEAEMHCATNSLKIFELDSLRHQILDLHAVSEDKETIARLGFELNNCKATEIESSKKISHLRNEVLHLRDDLSNSKKMLDETRLQLHDCQKICSTRCSSYEDVIDFLRRQYAGSTSMTSLQRFEVMMKNVIASRDEIDSKMKEVDRIKDISETQQELLTNRLAIVERLKDILEQKIGSDNVENIMQTFSDNSQYTLNEIRLKRQITKLDNDLKISNEKLLDYESTIVRMECEMMKIQQIWGKEPDAILIDSEPGIEPKVAVIETKSAFTQARVENKSVEVQSEPFDFPSKIVAQKSPEKTVKKNVENSSTTETNSVSDLKAQLVQALDLASERSSILIKYESKMAEYVAKIDALEKAIAEKNSQFKTVFETKSESKKSIDSSESSDDGDKAAMKSTINSLQKMINQKEETIGRYQHLLKNDRDEHSNAAASFQRELSTLREQIAKMQEKADENRKISQSTVSGSPKIVEESMIEPKPDIETEEKIVRLVERASTLEAELHIAKELGERWHRLADERLQHMDHMRERLEEQHKNELDSYRSELNKWQTEAGILGRQLSENRMELAKGNISTVKELQERDGKIQQLTVAYQQLQNEFEMMETMTMAQPAVTHGNSTSKIQEMAQALGRDQAQHFQSEIDLLRRQIKSQNEKEKMYKDQIADLKQQLSRRYMAVKSEERRTSNREMQLEKKLKNLEEELERARVQLDREYRVQEAKRIKTAEELSLWEKQKKWQQLAEKLKKQLKDKTEDYKKLNVNYEKLKAVVSCMEREKWYLRSKLKLEGGTSVGVTAGTVNDFQLKILENSQIECQTLRDRVKELTDRLESEDGQRLQRKLEQQRIRIASLEAVTEGNAFVIDQLEKLETAKGNLEKNNIRLETENFEYKMELEKLNLDTPRLREKVEHLEKYVELLKIEKSSESSPRSTDKDLPGPKKSVIELEKTVFILKRIVEKLQAENKRLKIRSTRETRVVHTVPSKRINGDGDSTLTKQYEQAQKRVVALETDLQLAEQRIAMLENSRQDDDNSGDVGILRQQLAHKSELLDKVKQLLTRAAINEKSLRQRIHQMEMKQTLSTIPECSLVSSPDN